MMNRIELNDTIATKLLQMADLLQQQGSSSYRVAAYRRGADTVQNLQRSVADLLEEDGLPALCALPEVSGFWSLVTGTIRFQVFRRRRIRCQEFRN